MEAEKEKETYPEMWTLHINDFEGYTWKQKKDDQSGLKKCKELLSLLYKSHLKEDTKFHFFYEPEIIIRFSSKKCLDETAQTLKSKKIGYDIYSYPIPQKSLEYPRYGEQTGGIVLKYFPTFLNIFHEHSVAAIIMDETDHFLYMERVIHCMFNPRAYSRNEEGEHLTTLAIFKSGLSNVKKFLESE